jgi:hypothetical protein
MFEKVIERGLPGVITTDQVAKRSLSVAPMPVTLLVTFQ